MLVDVWTSKYGSELLPLQERAVRDYDLLGGDSLIVSAPTCSGKTFCAEVAAARAFVEGRKVVFLVPLKALAEERFAEFEEKYEKLGVRTVISTSDRTEYDRPIEAGDFDIAVIVYEKFNQALLRNIDLLGSVDLLVIDELQMIGDESRGPLLELILLKVLHYSHRCRVIGLSAVLGDARKLAVWIGARVLAESHRPVELRQGVLCDNVLAYRCYNSGDEGTEEMASLTSGISALDVILENVARLVNSGEQVLVFLKSRRSCVRMAKSLAERLSSVGYGQAHEELAPDEDCLLSENLSEVLTHGIAFHNSDLSHHQRRVVEKYYLRGDIRVIFATATLSLGLNLPAQTVFLETYKYCEGASTRRPMLSRLSWSDYENMGGRAGRLKFRTGFGRSIVVANGALEREMLWMCYVRGKAEELEGHLFSRDTSDLVLDLVVSRCAANREALLDVLRSSFSEAADGLSDAIDCSLARLSASSMVSETAGVLTPTAYGEKLVRLGLSVSTGQDLRKLCESTSGYSELVWLYELCDSHEGNQVYLPHDIPAELEHTLFRKFASLVRCGGPVSERLGRILDSPDRVEARAFSRIRLSLALHDWVRGVAMPEIESRYRIYAGTVMAAGDTVGWLAQSAFSLMGVMGFSLKRRVGLRRLSFEVRHGLPVAARKLYSRIKACISRKDMLLLHLNGVSTVRSLMSRGGEFLSGLIGSSKAEGVMKQLMGKPLQDEDSGSGVGSASRAPKITLRLTATMIRDRYRVVFRDRPILLTAKSFKYLMKLAAQRSLDGRGWLDKEELEPGFNQARYLYNLRKELGGTSVHGRELIENDRQGKYRISLPADEIHFDLAALLLLEDFEIAELSRRLQSASLFQNETAP